MSGIQFGRQSMSGHLVVPEESKEAYPVDVESQLREDAAAIIARYPQARSALLPMLHLVQSVDGYITGRGIDLCAELLELSTAEVSGVATFYTQYKRHPNGRYTVGVCTNTLCAIMGGDAIWDAVSEHLGIGHDETTEDGMITLERIECNAACDYAPVVMTNWEFFDNQTPESTIALVDELRAGTPVVPTRGPDRVSTFKEVSRTLAGFSDGLADQGVGAGPASLAGLEVAHEHGWTAPGGRVQDSADSPDSDRAATADEGATDTESDGDAPGRTEVTPKSDEAAAGTQSAPDSSDPAEETHDEDSATEDEITDEDSAANESAESVEDATLFTVDDPADSGTTSGKRKRRRAPRGKDQA